MAKSKYKERILEELRTIHAKEKMLYEILRDCKETEGEETDGESDTVNR